MKLPIFSAGNTLLDEKVNRGQVYILHKKLALLCQEFRRDLYLMQFHHYPLIADYLKLLGQDAIFV